MSANTANVTPEPDWEDVFADPVVRGLTRFTPPNSAEYHDESQDERIRENMEQQAEWLHRIMQAAISED